MLFGEIIEGKDVKGQNMTFKDGIFFFIISLHHSVIFQIRR